MAKHRLISAHRVARQQLFYWLICSMSKLLELNAEHGDHNEVPLVAFIRERNLHRLYALHSSLSGRCDSGLGKAYCIPSLPTSVPAVNFCLPPCPVDCIDMIPIKQTIDDWKWSLPGEMLASNESSSAPAKEPAQWTLSSATSMVAFILTIIRSESLTPAFTACEPA